jgi:hypothetical protein
MAASFKPDGYSTVSPYLIATGAEKVIDFLKQAFGARELRRYEMPDGSIMHAEVRIGDTVVMVATPETIGPPCQRIYMCTLIVWTRSTSERSRPAASWSNSPSVRKTIQIVGVV